MIAVSAALALLAASGAMARTGDLGPTNYYNAATGLVVGTLSQVVNCTTTLNGASLGVSPFTITLGGALSATVTSSGQAFLVGRAVVSSTAKYATSLRNLGVTNFNGSVNSTIINAQGSTAGSFDIGKTNRITFPNTSIVANSPIVLNIPATASAPLSIGPITAASGSSQIVYSIGAASVNINATIGGKNAPTVVTCPATTPVKLLAFTTVGGSSFTSAAGVDLPPITTTSNNSLIGSAGTTYTCTVSGVSGTIAVPISITAYSTDLSVPAGSQFAYQNGHGVVNVTQAAANALLNTISGTKPTSFRLTVNSLFVTGTNIRNAPLKINSAPIVGDTIQLSSTTGTYLANIPGNNGLLPNITLVAGTAGTGFTFLGNASVTIDSFSSSGALVKSFTGTCAQPANPAVPLLPITIF